MEEPAAPAPVPEPFAWPLAFTIVACMVTMASCSVAGSMVSEKAAIERTRAEVPRRIAETNAEVERARIAAACPTEK